MKHPAKFSESILGVIGDVLDYNDFQGRILDPFAGTGRVHEFNNWNDGVHTFGLEIEPSWAAMHERTQVGDATKIPWPDRWFDAIVTSPCYGNRMADNDPRDTCITYRSALGEPLADNNAGGMQWGDQYRLLHGKAWRECARVLKPGGLFILNVSDHVRAGVRQRVAGWHLYYLGLLGFHVHDVVPVPTRRMKRGANHEARVAAELVVVLRAG